MDAKRLNSLDKITQLIYIIWFQSQFDAIEKERHKMKHYLLTLIILFVLGCGPSPFEFPIPDDDSADDDSAEDYYWTDDDTEESL